MDKLSICIDTHGSRFLDEAREGRNILCGFHLRIGEESFPGENWLDFPVIVLAWWLDGYIILTETTEPVENLFMNGPFEFVSRARGKVVELTFWRRTLTGRIKERSPIRLSLRDYKNSLTAAAQKLVNTLVAHSVSSPDLDKLKTALRSANHLAGAPRRGNGTSGGE
jgi:hypothetical protein